MDQSSTSVAETLSARLLRHLRNPWVDRALAVAAVVPYVRPIVLHFRDISLNVPDLTYLLQVLVLVGTMVFRRAPVRVTAKPQYWALTLVATYWGFFTISISEHGRPLVGPWLSSGVSLASLALMLWARISLGRNIGLVPAQRRIITRGAYRYMRHPIYTANFMAIVGEIVSNFSPWNLLFLALGAFWFALKSLIEERFLSEDPAYAAYLRQVRWRWIPLLV